MRPLPLPLHSYRPQSSARLVNWYPEVAPAEAKARIQLARAPGIATAANPNLGIGRGLYRYKDTLYAICGTSLISVNEQGATTTLAIVPGTDRATFAENADELAICVNDTVYVWDGSTIVQATTGIAQIASLNGYILGIRTGALGQWAASALQDAKTWGALNFATAESSPDPLVGIVVDHGEVLLGGTQTVEPWYNAGISGFPFLRSPSTGVIELGVAAGQSMAKQDNSTFWLASDLTVRRLAGANPVRVSQHGVEQAIRGYASPRDAYGFAFSWNGHLFYALTFPGVATWVYDATTGEWHERKSEGLPTWDVLGSAEAYQRVYVQRASDGRIGYLSGTTCAEFEAPFRTDEIQFGTVYDSGLRIEFNRLEVRFRARKEQTGNQASPGISLHISDDGGDNYRLAGSRASVSLGAIGQKPRVFWDRLGSSRDRSFLLRVSDPNPLAIEDVALEARKMSA